MDKNIENHEFNLRQFTYTATRWDINIIHETKTNNMPFAILTRHVINANKYFDDFKNQLRIEIDKPENGKAFEIDIKDRFLPGIKNYFAWYNVNHTKIEKLWGNPNFYSLMLDIMASTEREINKYHSPIDNNIYKHSNIFKNNAFDVWSYLFNELEIKENSRTDVKFIFEEMKKEALIHQSITQNSFLGWIDNTYEILIEKTSNHSRTSNRIKAFNRAKKHYIK